MGEAIRRVDTTTEAWAVPPRISAPYDGKKVTSFPSSIAACASSVPINMTP